MIPPRYFVASGPGSATAPFPGEVVEPLGCFLFPWAGGAEWVVGHGSRGELTAQPIEPRLALRPAVQAQLAFHETAGRRSRPLPIQSVCLFEAQMVEQTPDLPGFNDPLLVHGTLLGPFSPGIACVVRRPGHLTVTRADLLHGLVAGAPFAFQHADRLTGKGARTFHVVLPGDREERLREGHGAVLAFPLLGADPALNGVGNEAVVDEMLYAVLAAVWRDVAREAPPPARKADELPVPSRAAHESRLTAQGFSIEGEAAIRKNGRGWRSLFTTERRRLPPQGDTDVFLALATEALRFLGLTGLRLDALGTDQQPPRAPSPALPPPPLPALPPPPLPALPPDTSAPLPGNWRTTADGREAWMRRFIEAQERRYGRG
jgi:hypothetical protein